MRRRCVHQQRSARRPVKALRHLGLPIDDVVILPKVMLQRFVLAK